MMRKLVELACLFVVLSVWILNAQTTTGTFGGQITDSSGSAVPAAEVIATNVDTGQTYRSVTPADGNYLIPQVPPGNYSLQVRAKGFKTLQREGLTLDVNGKATLNLTLDVGQVTEKIFVTGEAPLLRTQDAQVGDVINSKMISDLPQLDRNPLELLRLSGNVSGSATFGNQNDTRINGGRASGLDVLVDGNTILSGKGHFVTSNAPPSMEQVEEFKVITNGIPAEYGRVSGGLVELVTKGGTNQLHGQGFEFFRNQLFNANSWEQNWQSPYVPGQKAARTQFHQNDFGGNIGGPVILPKLYEGKNKTFFFFNYEQLIYRQAGALRLGSVLTPQERNGDLGDLVYGGVPAKMYDPMGAIGKDAKGNKIKLTLFPNNGTLIPASRIDPLAKLIMSFQPLPNRAPIPGYTIADNYAGAQSNSQDRKRWETRVDHNLTDNSRLTFRLDRSYTSQGLGQWYDSLSPADIHQTTGSIEGSLGWTWTATPTTVVEIRGGVVHDPNFRGPNWNVPNQSSWPIDPLFKTLTRGIPADLVYRDWAGDTGWGGGNNLGNQDLVFQSLDVSTNYSAVGAVTKIWGRHTVKTGVETRRFFDNHWEDLFGTVDYAANGANAVAQANYNYGQGPFSSPNNRPNSLGSFLLGIPDSASKQTTLNLTNDSNYYAAYVQDDFKVNKRLTINVGLRWDMDSPLTDRHNDLTRWNPNAPSAYTVPANYNWTGSLSAAGLTPAQIAQVPTPSWVTAGKFPNGSACFVATPQCTSRTQTNYHPWQFAPRLGAAYQLNSKTVLRASWGIMYLTSTGDYWNGWTVDASHAASNGTDRDPVTGNIAHNNQSLVYPNQYIPFVRDNVALNYNGGGGYGAEGVGTSVNMHPPHEYDWNFNVQREIPWHILLEAGYNGNHGTELITAAQQSTYPVGLIQPQYSALFKTMVANPLAGQINPTGLDSNPKVPLGLLMLANPAFGGLLISGQNIGRSNYNAGTIKLQKRLSQGVTFLFNYTYSKLLDNVGQVSAGAGAPGGGLGSKPYQSFQNINDLYGYSPQDQTHRLTFYHEVQFPVGQGRKFLGSPASVGAKVLNGFLGGWGYAGIWIYYTGTPLSFVPQSTSVSQASGVNDLWGNITGNIGQVTPSNYGSDNSVLTSGLNDPSKMLVRRFDPTRFTQPVDMTPGNVGPIYPWIRNPSGASYDASLMKDFRLFERADLQFRVEAQNVLNMRGFGAYDTTVGDPNFGLITSSTKSPRNLQISARIFF